jgi:hypothetical protein
MIAHEVFHILSRHDPVLRERLYSLFGFQRCARADVPESAARLRITNPDAVASLHSIRVRHRGQPVDALPYIRFRAEPGDPAQGGLLSQIHVRWLLVDRAGDDCRVRQSAAGVEEVDPEQLEGLYEKIGRNTGYLFHPEEIIADNFAMLFLASLGPGTKSAPTPDMLEKLRAALFRN